MKHSDSGCTYELTATIIGTNKFLLYVISSELVQNINYGKKEFSRLINYFCFKLKQNRAKNLKLFLEFKNLRVRVVFCEINS